MPPKTTNKVVSEEAKFQDLISWTTNKHPGFKCSLVSKEIPGAGRGLFAAKDIPAGQSILEVPSTALLNPLTIASSSSTIPEHLFPLASKPPPAKKTKTTRASLSNSNSPRLNTTQLLTLYLALTRDPKNRHPSPWKQYLSTLPVSFDPWHPLTWYYKQGEEGWWQKILAFLPVSARKKLEEVKGRYEGDLAVLKIVLTEEAPFKDQNLYPEAITDDILLWAWLNVNTRTVSIPLDLPGTSSLQNHTLVPILDLINHSSKEEERIPTPIQFPSSTSGGPGSTSSRGIQPHLIPGKVGFRLIAPERGLKEGEEVKFEYGAHSTETLFTEYGFCPEEKRGDWLSQVYGECDVNALVQEMFPIKSEKVRTILEELGCWQKNNIYSHPTPIYGSHGLIMTLRLYFLNKGPKNKHTTENMEQIRLGLDTFADGCEGDVRKSLKELCQRVRDEHSDHINKIGFFMIAGMKHRQPQEEIDAFDAPQAAGKKTKGMPYTDYWLDEKHEGDQEFFQALNQIQALWYERDAIAKKYKNSLAQGNNIWN